METSTTAEPVIFNPESFEDLPDQAIGMILRKLSYWSDKMYLTQASPSARRITKGPKADPGCLGPIEFLFMERARKAVDISDGVRTEFYVDLNHPQFDLAFLTSYLQSRARAFSEIVMNVRAHEPYVPTVARLIAAYAPHCLGKMEIGLVTDYGQKKALAQSKMLLDALTSNCSVPALCSLNHIGTALNGQFVAYDSAEMDASIELLRGLKSFGSVKLKIDASVMTAFPSAPGLADCLTHLDCGGTVWESFPRSFKALKDITLHRFKYRSSSISDALSLSAQSIESVHMTFDSFAQPLTLDAFAAMPNLKTLKFGLEIHKDQQAVPVPRPDDPYYRKEVVLPALETLYLLAPPSVTPDRKFAFPLLSNLKMPTLKNLMLIYHMASLEPGTNPKGDLTLDLPAVLGPYPQLETAYFGHQAVILSLMQSIGPSSRGPKVTYGNLVLKFGDLRSLKNLFNLTIYAVPGWELSSQGMTVEKLQKCSTLGCVGANDKVLFMAAREQLEDDDDDDDDGYY